MTLLFFLLLSSCFSNKNIIQAHSSLTLGELQIFCPSDNTSECETRINTNKGSATRIKWNDNYFWLTAAHVCEPQITEDSKYITKERLLIVSIAGSGKQETIQHYRLDTKWDICILVATPGPARKLAKKVPALGESVITIAFPGGVFDKEMYPIYDGRWIGYHKAEDKCLSTIPVTGGSSGAAILNNNGEIVSIITSVMKSFNHFTMATCLDDLTMFLNKFASHVPQAK